MRIPITKKPRRREKKSNRDGAFNAIVLLLMLIPAPTLLPAATVAGTVRDRRTRPPCSRLLARPSVPIVGCFSGRELQARDCSKPRQVGHVLSPPPARRVSRGWCLASWLASLIRPNAGSKCHSAWRVPRTQLIKIHASNEQFPSSLKWQRDWMLRP